MKIRKQHVTTWIIALLSISLCFSQTLKEKAQEKGKYIGNILSINGLDQLTNQNFQFPENGIIRDEFNALVLENDMKMGFILSSPPADPFNIQSSDFTNKSRMDRFTAYCKTDVTEELRSRGHALIWYNQAPGWLFDAINGNNGWSEWTTQDIYDFSESYIKAMINYFGSSIDEWDVFNEAFSDNSSEVWRSGTWYDKVSSGNYNGQPSSYQLFFEMCFKWAHEIANNDVMLMYNDYNIEQKGNFKSDNMYAAISTAVSNGSPINGVGFQSHIAHEVISNAYMDDVVDRIRELGSLGDDNDGLGGLKVAITELDIHSSNANLDDQSIQNSYWQVVSKTLAEPNVDELLIWGVSDKDSWITLISSGYFGDKTGFLPWGDNYSKNENPGAYTGVLDGLNSLTNKSFPPLGLSLNWRNHGVHGGTSGNGDKIISINAPSSVEAGAISTVTVEYSSTQNRDIIIAFQLDSSPWTTYESVKTDVSSGTGTLNVSVAIPSDAPIANNAYQFQVFITTNNGNWNTRIDNLSEMNVDVTSSSNQSIPDGTYYIKKSSSNTYINANSAVGGCVSVQGVNGNSSKWSFRHIGNEEYEIMNIEFSTSRLEVPHPQSGNYAPVATTDWNGDGNNLIWKAVEVGNDFQFKPKHDQNSALDIWEENPAVVHLWSSNTGNNNQVFQLISTTDSRSAGSQNLILNTAIDREQELKLYPNPASDLLFVNGSFSRGDVVEIIGVDGKSYNKKEVSTNTSELEIDISSLYPGIYILKFQKESIKVFIRQ